MRHSTLIYFSLTLLSWIAVVRSQNCQLQVPANPLTAQGLATPYVLTGCNQLDFANQGVFVEAAILDPATGKIQIYSPLVINAGMTPVGNGTGTSTTNANPTTSASATTSAGPATGSDAATGIPANAPSGSMSVGTTTAATTGASDVPFSTIASAEATATKAARQAASAGFYVPPIVPTLPDNAVVGIWFGSNAVSVTLTGSTGGCVNGLGNSVFGQFAYCNGQAWFSAAKSAVSQGLINLPVPGTGSGGQACPTTHDFRVVDQDQSDNVVATYLLIGGNTLAQNTPANNKANPAAVVLSNASDNALITQFIDPALGCTPYQNPCTTCPTGQSPALATDELLANFFPPAGGPALVPLTDPMVLVNGQQSLQKVNLYRDGTGQPQADNNNASGLTYCQQIAQSGIFINNNQQLFTNAGSPAANMANSLFTFLAMRFSAAFGPAPGLGCTGLLNVANPVSLTMDGNGIVTAATINTQLLQQILAGGTGASATTAATTSSASAPTSIAASLTSSAVSTIAGPTTTSPASGADTSAATSATGSATASQTGVLLHLTSAAPTTASGTSMNGVAHSGGQTSATVTSASAATTSAAGSITQVPTASSTPTCANAATVTVTVTATACPTQTPASSVVAATAASASPTACDNWGSDGWNGGQNRGGHCGKRSTLFAADRMRRKSRSASFD